jgi:hypothetical protein
MTEPGRNVRTMSLVRRVEIGALAILVLALAAAAAIAAGAGSMGLEMPKGLGEALSSAEGMLGWLRLLVLAALVYGVVRVRED